jgi:hypothetical protein
MCFSEEGKDGSTVGTCAGHDGGQPGSRATEGGKHDICNEEECRDGRSGEVYLAAGVLWALDQPPSGNHLRKVLGKCPHPAAFSDPAMATMLYPTATHYR